MAEMLVIAGLFHLQERTLAVLLVMVVIFATPASAEAKYIFDDAHGLVRFTVKLAGLTEVEGRFTETHAAITYNESDLTKSSVTALIHVASIANDTPYDRNEWQYHVLGRKLYQHGKIKAALDVANQYVEAFPQSARALDDLADAYEAMGDKKQAIMLFEKSAKVDPFDANAVENLRWIDGLAK